MKVTFKTEDLKKQLSRLGAVIKGGNAIAALKCVRVFSYGESPALAVRILGADIDRSLGVNVPTAVAEGLFDYLISYEKLSKVVNAITAPETTLTLNDEGTVVALRAAKYRAELQTTPVSQFPLIMDRPTDESGNPKPTASLDLDGFIAQIGRIEFAVPQNAGKFTVTVAKVEAVQSVDGDKDTSFLRIIGSDGYRLAISTAAKNVGTFELVLPKPALDLIKKLEGDKTVTVYQTEAGFLFDTDTATLTVNRTAGVFPAYERVIPPSFKTTFVVSAEALLAATNRLSPLSNDDNPTIIFRATEGSSELQLFTASSESGVRDLGEDVVDLTAPAIGPSVAFALKHEYYVDFLTRAKGPLVVQANDSTTLVDFHADGDSYRFLQMPQKAN